MLKRYSFLWVALPMFLMVLGAHYGFGLAAYVSEHGNSEGWITEWLRDVLENWQSEIGESIILTVGLTWLRFEGSPQSREGDERMEAKLDAILQLLKEETNGQNSQAR
jgi:hypothetical protein